MDLGAMAMKRYSAFPKAPALLEPHHQIVFVFFVISRTFVDWSYPYAEKQSVYSTAPADWATGYSLEGLTPLRCSRCILQFPQPTGQGVMANVLNCVSDFELQS